MGKSRLPACTQVRARGQGGTGRTRGPLFRTMADLLLWAIATREDTMERELTQLTNTIKTAGARALELSKQGFEVHRKKDRSPVTTADLEVNRILHEMCETHFSGDGWLSEESPDDPSRLDRERVWIVDPIDGTKAYVNRVPEFCISVGLVEKGSPILAAIFNPSTDELFTACRGRGLRLNGKPVSPARPADAIAQVMVNPWEFRRGRWVGLDGQVQCRPMYSIAHALALVAGGRSPMPKAARLSSINRRRGFAGSSRSPRRRERACVRFCKPMPIAPGRTRSHHEAVLDDRSIRNGAIRPSDR